MGQIRVVFLWHMHQPFYKDLVSREYRLPWVRMHALKDYYGMVKLMQEFPQARQTFNLAPSLMLQIEDYAGGSARDPFLEVVSKPATELTPEDRRFALRYLFFANPERMIRRYPRYAELWAQANSLEKMEAAERRFTAQDFTDLQVLSQLAWFDEFFLQEPEVAAWVRKGRNFTRAEQARVVALEPELMARVLPEYAAAARRGSIEISVSPFYHPILPLVCDSNQGRASAPGLPLPQRFQHPEDAREQLRRGIEFLESRLGVRARGAWPSEGSLSEEVLALGHQLGLEWMASDEGVLGRSLGHPFERDGDHRLQAGSAERLYRVYRYEKENTRMHLLFRDCHLSDLIGFAYAGMDAGQAANHFVHSIQESAQPLLDKGEDATVSIILDGENAWEHYPESGRDFLRRLYAAMAQAGMEMVTVAEAIARSPRPATLGSLVPGSWIDANFNVWIGAAEDNKSWDYLKAARDFYAEKVAGGSAEAAPAGAEAATAAPAGGDAAGARPAMQRELAFEELLIAEGSDWNWWYGPEHHSANDRDFDELYRQHLSNVYRALGASPPEYLGQSLIMGRSGARLVPQTCHIHPVISGDRLRYFDWIGAAMISADIRDSAMHGHARVLESLHAGIDEERLYGRVDPAPEKPGFDDLALVIHIEVWAPEAAAAARQLRLEARLAGQELAEWRMQEEPSPNGAGETVAGRAEASSNGAESEAAQGTEVRWRKTFEFGVPLALLGARVGGRLRVRVSAWRNGLPLDSLPSEGWLELLVASEETLRELA